MGQRLAEDGGRGLSTIRLPMPHAGQKRVRSEAKRFNVLSAGRRWRKTTLVMPIAVEVMLGGGTVVWGAPTYDQVATAYEEMRRGCRGVARFRSSPSPDAEIPGGGRCLFRSLDNPDNARSKTADLIVVDEAGDVIETAWAEVLYPMLMDTHGGAWLMGTPKGRNWFWREFTTASDNARTMGEWAAWQIPTLGCRIEDGTLVRAPHPYENPNIPFEEVRAIFDRTPERTFRQEILAEFIEDGGSVFRGVRAAATARAITHAEPGRRYLVGVDWGKSEDFTVITVLDDETGEVVRIDRFNQIDYTIQRARVVAAFEAFRPMSVVVERNSIGEPLIEELVRAGLPVQPFTTTNASKSLVIDALALAFERGDIKIPDDPVLIAELEAFEMERLPGGAFRFSAPSGMHDDCVMSLAFAWHAHTGHGTKHSGFLALMERALRDREGRAAA